MKKMLLASAMLAASLALAGCNRGATTNNAAAPANKAAPAAPAGNTAGGNTAGGGAPTGGTAQQNFNFTNQSGQTVTTLQVSPTGEAAWGEDILGRDVLPNGETVEIGFERGDDRCFWDIRATGEAAGSELVMMNQNLCETTQITALPAQ